MGLFQKKNSFYFASSEKSRNFEIEILIIQPKKKYYEAYELPEI